MIKKRIFAYLIDLTIIIVIIGIISILVGENLGGGHYKVHYPYSILVFLTYPVYFITIESIYGYTLGKKIMKLRVVNNKNKKINFIQAFFRHIFDFIDIIIGIFIMITNNEKKRIGDFIAKTKVVSTEQNKVQKE